MKILIITIILFTTIGSNTAKAGFFGNLMDDAEKGYKAATVSCKGNGTKSLLNSKGTPLNFAIYNNAQLMDIESNVVGLDFGIIGTCREATTFGLSVAPFISEQISMRGLQVALMSEADELKGFQLGLVNRTNELRGFQASLMNFSVDARGFQIGAFGNATGQSKGFQIAALSNYAFKGKGLQISLFNMTGYYESFIKMPFDVDQYKGVQVGAVNTASDFKGLQLGLINKAKELKGIQVGILNINKDSKIPFIPFVRFSF